MALLRLAEHEGVDKDLALGIAEHALTSYKLQRPQITQQGAGSFELPGPALGFFLVAAVGNNGWFLLLACVTFFPFR